MSWTPHHHDLVAHRQGLDEVIGEASAPAAGVRDDDDEAAASGSSARAPRAGHVRVARDRGDNSPRHA